MARRCWNGTYASFEILEFCENKSWNICLSSYSIGYDENNFFILEYFQEWLQGPRLEETLEKWDYRVPIHSLWAALWTYYVHETYRMVDRWDTEGNTVNSVMPRDFGNV